MTELENEVLVEENVEATDVTTIESNTNFDFKKLGIVSLAVASGVGIAVLAARKLKIPDKINEIRKKKLEKAGYVVAKYEDLLEDDNDSEDEETEE